MTYHRLCGCDELPDGASRMFWVGELAIGLFRVDGEYFALENTCPHAGASLAHGIVQDGVVACRIHHWRFRICDGAYLDEDRPAANRRCFAVRIRSGDVEVLLPD